MKQFHFTLLLFYIIFLASCDGAKKSWSVKKSRVGCQTPRGDSCQYVLLKGISLGDEPGYFIDTVYLNKNKLLISVKPGKYKFDPISGENIHVKFPLEKISVYSTYQAGNSFVVKNLLPVKIEENKLSVQINKRRTLNFLVGTKYEFGMNVTLVQIIRSEQ